MLCGKSVFSLLVRDAAARCSHVTRVDGHFRWRSAPAPAQFAYGGDDSFVRRSGGKEGGGKAVGGERIAVLVLWAAKKARGEGIGVWGSIWLLPTGHF